MNDEQRREAIFGSFDGIVSVTGFVFGLLVHHSPESAIAIGGLGGAIAASVSMGIGEFEKGDGPGRLRIRVALVMFMATLIGSLIPIWPFFIFGKSISLLLAGIGCLVVATWIGFAKHKGVRGFVMAYATLLAAAGLTLAIVSVIP
jgi:VIT1/CCC1 family predicted Fe2+/Mn2+ transporter